MCTHTHSDTHVHTHTWAELSSRGGPWIRSQYEVPSLLNITPVVVTENTQIYPSPLPRRLCSLPGYLSPTHKITVSHRPAREERGRLGSLKSKEVGHCLLSEFIVKTRVFIERPRAKLVAQTNMKG